MAEIELRGKYGVGRATLVDDEDFDRLSQYKWYLKVDKGMEYVASTVGAVKMHRIIMGQPAGMVVDHINHDTLDNRKCNLRVCTRAENSQNGKARHNRSGYKGVTKVGGRSKRWLAQIMVDGKKHILGRYLDPKEAAKVYDEAAEKLHGEFALTNRAGGLM